MTINDLNAKIASEMDAVAQLEAQAAEQKRETNDEEIAAIEEHNSTIEATIAERDELDRRLKAKEATANLRKRFEGEPVKTAVTSGVRDGIESDPKRGFSNLGDFARSVFEAKDGGAFTDRRLIIGAAATGMSFGEGASAGFLMPPEFSSSIWDGMNSGADSLIGRTDSYPVTGESLTFPANAETSRANGSRYGGVRGYWLAEAEQMTASKPKLREMRLEPQEMAVLIYATDKLLRNAGAAESYLRKAATEEITFMVSDAIVAGDGSGKPKGLLNSACKIEVAKESSQPAATVVHNNISKMWARLHPRSRATSVWLANIDVEPELDNMYLPVTNIAGSENVGGLDHRVRNPEANTLKGRPVIYVESCKTLGTAGDLILCDLGAYATGTRGGVSSDLSIHLRFDYNETAFRFVFAVDGQTWLNSAITPFNGSNTLSSVVTLAVRS